MGQPEIVVEFEDKYGDQRIIHRHKGESRMQLKRLRPSVVQELSKAAGVIIGTNIRERRLAMGMTMEELCHRSGLVSSTPKQRIYEIERGSQREGILLGTLYAIARALEVSPASLLPCEDQVFRSAEVQEQMIVPKLAIGGRIA